jgi:hypothetical protein
MQSKSACAIATTSPHLLFRGSPRQYDAAQAYIRSQAHAGWTLIRHRYDDGGFSGGSTDRPERNLTCNRARKNHPAACKRIQAWAENHEFSAIVWTAIGPRFQEKIGVHSADAAVAYIAGLQEPTRTLALDYIRKAPADVVTPVRNKVSAAFGPLAERTEVAS